jgi:hypothetical protein
LDRIVSIVDYSTEPPAWSEYTTTAKDSVRKKRTKRRIRTQHGEGELSEDVILVCSALIVGDSQESCATSSSQQAARRL